MGYSIDTDAAEDEISDLNQKYAVSSVSQCSSRVFSSDPPLIIRVFASVRSNSLVE